MKWTTYKDIVEKLTKKWNQGTIITSELTKLVVFPMTIPLQYPKSKELLESFSNLSNWITDLKQHSINYEIIEEEVNYRTIGKNKIPKYIRISSMQDFLKIIHKEKEYQLFVENSSLLLTDNSSYLPWIQKYPFKIIVEKEYLEKLLKIVHYFKENTIQGYYLRQLTIPGIDTKFIENNKTVLREMLDLILEESYIDKNQNNFEKRYYLKTKPIFVRMRFLDDSLDNDVQLTIEECNKRNFHFEKVFFVENEINYLSFPKVKNSCVIFTKGYGVESLKEIEWLKKEDIYYWGDIDTHGFQILSLARTIFPQIKSFFMDEATLMKYQSMWVYEQKPVIHPIMHLSQAESDLVNKLQSNLLGTHIRFEQEYISYDEVKRVVLSL